MTRLSPCHRHSLQTLLILNGAYYAELIVVLSAACIEEEGDVTHSLNIVLTDVEGLGVPHKHIFSYNLRDTRSTRHVDIEHEQKTTSDNCTHISNERLLQWADDH